MLFALWETSCNSHPSMEHWCLNKSVASKLGCMTSVNIWQDTVLYDELTINERQKKDQAFSSMLDEVRHGSRTPECIQALHKRVI